MKIISDIFKWLSQKFAIVYCEDCANCMPGDNKMFGEDEEESMCKAYPVEVDCSDIDTYVTKDRKIEIVKSYKRCKNIRIVKSMPLSYSSTCFKFKLKSS